MADRALAVQAAAIRATPGVSRNRFYFWMALLLALLMFAGFAPSVYMRGAFFEVAPIPLYLHVHAAILTGWFLLFVVQTSLASSGRLADHRKLGTAGAIYAAVAFIAALVATFGFVPRTLAGGFTFDMDVSAFNEGSAGITIGQFISNVVWSNLGAALSFAILVALAIAYRGRPETHKRLMLLASISFMGPALARVARWPFLGGEQGPFTFAAILGLLAALVVYDLVTLRRVHPATLFGAGLRVLTLFGMQFVASSEPGLAFIRALA
jgi:hypothetical protein